MMVVGLNKSEAIEHVSRHVSNSEAQRLVSLAMYPADGNHTVKIRIKGIRANRLPIIEYEPQSNTFLYFSLMLENW